MPIIDIWDNDMYPSCAKLIFKVWQLYWKSGDCVNGVNGVFQPFWMVSDSGWLGRMNGWNLFWLKKYIWMNGWCLMWIYNNIILISVPLTISLSVNMQGD